MGIEKLPHLSGTDSVRTATMGMAVHLGALYTDIPQGVSQD